MRTIYKYALSLVAAILLLPACSDYLDKEPDDQLTLKMAFENKTSVEKWLAQIYSYIPDPYSNGTTEPCGDDFVVSTNWASVGFKALNYQTGNWSPMSEGVVAYWKKGTPRIRAAYVFLENVHALPTQGLSQDEVVLMRAEAEFFIAYYHMMMAIYYGSIPIIDHAFSPSAPIEELMVKQVPFFEAVDWICNKMLEASKVLPATYSEPKKYGRVTSLICLAMRARLMTFAASDLTNGNTDYEGYRNCDGVRVFSNVKDPERWKMAAEANKLVITAAEGAGCSLYREFLSDGKTVDGFLSYQNALLKTYYEGNNEIIWPVPNAGSAGKQGWDYNGQPRGTGGTGAIGVTQALVDAFFMADGTMPILGYDSDGEKPRLNPDSPTYSETGFSDVDEMRATRWGECQGGSSDKELNPVTNAGTFKMYCNREPRFYVSVLCNDAWFRRSKRKTNFYADGLDGKSSSSDYPCNGYVIRKRVDPNADPVTGIYKYRPGVLYRLAEAYLSYAESLCEYSIDKGSYGANKVEILLYINRIRERAGIPQYGDAPGMIPAPTTAEQMRTLIRQERRVELCCEAGIRFDDIRRWKRGDLIHGKFWGMNIQAKAQADYYKRTTYQTRKFISYWMPIPQDGIDENPNIIQVPGWN